MEWNSKLYTLFGLYSKTNISENQVPYERNYIMLHTHAFTFTHGDLFPIVVYGCFRYYISQSHKGPLTRFHAQLRVFVMIQDYIKLNFKFNLYIIRNRRAV
jgi:hypothetical protein